MKLKVTVQRVCYPPATKEGGNFYILATDKGKVKGKMPWRPKEHEQLVLDGEECVYHGQKEFAFTSAALDVPENPREQLHYVCERCPGIGHVIEDRIWAECGADWKNIKPGQVKRLDGVLYESFMVSVQAMELDIGQVRTVAALMAAGATMNMAVAAFQKWQEQTLGVVQADPFRLAELPGYGFSHVDREIRAYYGIGDDDPRRMKAATVHSLRRLTDDGSTVVSWKDLFSHTCALVGGRDQLVFEQARAMLQDGTLKGFDHDGGFMSLRHDFNAERDILAFVDGVTPEEIDR